MHSQIVTCHLDRLTTDTYFKLQQLASYIFWVRAFLGSFIPSKFATIFVGIGFLRFWNNQRRIVLVDAGVHPDPRVGRIQNDLFSILWRQREMKKNLWLLMKWHRWHKQIHWSLCWLYLQYIFRFAINAVKVIINSKNENEFNPNKTKSSILYK